MDTDKLISIIEREKIDFGKNQDKFISYCCWLLFDLEDDYVEELDGFIDAYQIVQTIYDDEDFSEKYVLPNRI